MLDKTRSQYRHEEPGYFALAQLPQRGSVASIAKGSSWWELDQIFKIYAGQFVVVTGVAGHGKSTFLLNLVVNWACEHGLKSFLYVPENEAHVREKFSLIWGDRQNFHVFENVQCFVQSAEINQYDQEPKTLDWVLNKAAISVVEDDVKLVLIDPWNEIERAKPKDMMMTDYIGQCLMWLKQFARKYGVTVILVAHPTKAGVSEGKTPSLADIEGCYSDDTETLTKRGWLHHGQLTLSDEVACFNPETNDVEYHQPSKIIRREFNGSMHRFIGFGYDLLVTPQHRMLVKPMWPEPVGANNGRGRPVKFPKGQWSFCSAHELPASPFTIPIAGNPISGADPDQVCIGNKSYPSDAFWRLVGWYVAEGHLGRTGLTWAQAEGALANEFSATFEAAGMPASVGWQEPHGKGKQRVGRWYIGNRFCPELIDWFRKNCGHRAASKQLPESAFDLSPRLKNILLDAYIDGDGSRYGDYFIATTVSKRLRDDLQRLCVEIGRSSSSSFDDPEIKHHQRRYSIQIGRKSRTTTALRTGRNASRENYRGLVWCLTVPTGAYFVRRNGRVTVCGNSMNWYNKCDNGLIVVRDTERPSCKIISAKVREIGAGKRGVCYFDVDEDTGIFKPQHGAVST